jgi:hypothetical protein
MNFSALKNITKKLCDVNVTEGIETFSKSIQEFGDSMDKLTKELNTTGTNKVKIWSEQNVDSQKISNDMEKIWGKKN